MDEWIRVAPGGLGERSWRALAAMSLGVVALLTCWGGVSAAPAHAAGVQVSAGFGSGTVDAYAKSSSSKKSGSSRSGSSKKEPPPPRLQYVTLIDCEPNSPSQNSVSDCAEIAGLCSPGLLRVRVFEAPLGTALGGDWTRTSSACVSPAEAHLGEVVIPQLSGRELRRLPIPAGETVLEPGNGYALVNLPTNVYRRDTGVTVIRTTVMGLPLVVRATPIAYTWDYGDGASRGPTQDPGAPYPNLTTAHTYSRPGSYEVRLSTTYSAEFSVNNGAFQPVPGTTQVTSPPVAVEVLSGRAHLRDQVE
ncbi:MAG: PKD domain-containing protein [Actinomycetales bacterium]